MYIFALVVFVFTSCENNEEIVVDRTTKSLTPDQQKMRSALETTTDILLDMVASDQTYFEEIKAINIINKIKEFEVSH